MNRQRYRKRAYRKRRLKAIIISSVAAAIALFVIFLAVGLSLAEKTRDYELDDDDDFEFQETDAESTRSVKTVNAYPLPLLEDGSYFYERLAKINENATSVCVSLNLPDGTILYRSSIASKFSYSIANDASTLATIINNIEGRDLYTTATLYIPTFEEPENDLEADVELSIWGAIVCEAIRDGIGDVLLIANGAEVDDVEKLCALAERIHITEENAVIGLCIPESVIHDEKSGSLIEKLSKKFDYLAFNATNIEGEGTLLENTEAAISNMQFQLMYYKMRVLIPRGENAEELSALAEIVTKHSISSWQALPH